ncbi:MAG: Gfo/Idh/MocA family oxidoreductase [Lachnospiraceae bacterium]|nr:Gfo/Idh/MocA family oxidoreductase [Lachnospiraceae bacterium]
MSKIRLGILGAADIAFQRFVPAALRSDHVEIVCVAGAHNAARRERFRESFGLDVTDDYDAILHREDIDAVYLPLPPALHHPWAKKALLTGKHVLVEKPSAPTITESLELVDLAQEKKLALHENYMFCYHSQLDAIQKIVTDGRIGEIRQIRAAFGFPRRAADDFRYDKALGGGALLDAGGYPLRLAALLLGDTVRVEAASLGYLPEFDVDIYGSALLVNDAGIPCQIGFGMDNAYQCLLEIWGSHGMLSTDRIFTAPETFTPTVKITDNSGTEEIRLSADAHFLNSLEAFVQEIESEKARDKMYRAIRTQARLLNEVRKKT